MAILQTMEAFEPPKYIASLIGAVNDGAKSAQTGAFLFLAVGLYLLATAFSATDEDLLLGKTVTISQIGASLPAKLLFRHRALGIRVSAHLCLGPVSGDSFAARTD
jgi:hypothetical protein